MNGAPTSLWASINVCRSGQRNLHFPSPDSDQIDQKHWLTHLYTHVLGVRLRTHEPLARSVIRRSLGHELPVIEGGVVPIFVLVVAWVTGASVVSGVRAAVYATAASIILLEMAAAWGVRSRDTGVWIRAVLGTVTGLGLVAVKVVLHV